MKEQGLYYPDGSYSSREEINRKRLAEELQGRSRVVDRTEFAGRRSFKEWSKIVSRQQRERQEILGIPEHISVSIETTEPILVSLIGDVHAGGEDIDYDRFYQDVDLTKQVGGYTMAVGDLTDSYFFMPGVSEQILAGDEQILYMQSALDELSEDNKLLAAWGGDHDMWSKDKSGAHTLYQDFQRRYNAHYLEGVSYVDLRLFDGVRDVNYGFVGSHRHKGFSVYNDAHSSLRQFRDEGIGAMVSFTAHNHVKAYLQQVHKLHRGDETVVHCLALGAYKKSDRYSRKKGWPRKAEESMGGFGILLWPTEKHMEVCWTIDEAVDKLERLR